ncbi:26S proteasome regulatory complex, non-ATPase subcomplex, Rpn2/Psmd1 subunit [Hortaea werneckii]|nr:26S proteasome regulatory complex, non-ATPase subcomplex, Rpn2/Psmd1 subunit [Hortaea werneckii]KAI7094056.1 26S proteasome regulatory complex, non-ATPase subcomplex, Rpn2/Psmd1 subunit [Hortaea werneckii]KAI7231651.1 26S proteasome regulatory complex, non-ATPase subcomplex, Rpn2/Psmd1 subunit [Hortaea werneckii]KAI7312493.1 26S proteasome regulatory complex, non-ATPase subcomplex, Rpn2/Psmd1 subunit [Hortaea werneckii]KAI7396340.1 26S proteasome regulatory complex, non-ATPase subcomplex, Rp
MVGLNSAAGLVGFLSEPDPALQAFALETLNDEIETVWTEVSGSIGQIEALYEDESFSHRELAALVLSKVYYQLQEYNEAMVFALGAGKLFDLENAEEYEDTIVAKCIDTYIALSALHNPPASTSSAKQSEGDYSSANGAASALSSMSSPTTPFSHAQLPSKSLLSRDEETAEDPSAPGGGNAGVPGAHPHPLTLPNHVKKNLQTIIRRIFESCYEAGAYRQVVGIAVEARNMDILREAILKTSEEEKKRKGKAASQGLNQTEELVEYVLDICMNVVQERGLRNEILKLVLGLLNDIPNPDYFAIARCVVYLNQHAMASKMLKELVQKGDGRSLAIAYQLSFDLYENGTQEFLQKIMEELPESESADASGQSQANGDAVRPGVPGGANENENAQESDQLLSELQESAGPAQSLPSRTKPKPETEEQSKAYTNVRNILQGTTSIELNLEFLYRSSRSDKAILNKVRDSLEARNSIFHTSVTFANAFMNAGTTIDSFFRENLEWLGKAVNWSKFTATAALGVIHRGNLGQGQKLLEPYLPKDNQAVSAGSAYSQGGSLYALGLIYTNHGTHVLDYLRRQFKATQEEVVQHGGALGLGVAGMATGSEDIYDELKNVLYQDSAINGEAVGLSMGLVMLGTGNVKALDDMIQYAHDTQHEKIVRGLAMGMALIMYARQEAADDLINGLLEDADPALRYGGIFTVALAYCGSGSNKAVRKLLHVAVSDVSDDVRRAAVMSLGFVLFRKPGSVPRMVELLSESYNPHVRYGATMALGIACAGTGLDEAIDLLEPMTKDSVDFVRQGALIALAMIMVQQNEAMNPKVTTIRERLQKSIGDRHEDAMAKFGCAIALGIIDAGGRNCTIGLQTQTGNLNMEAIVGMAIFTQYWYWFPLTHFLSLSFTPTAIIGVDQDLQLPKFSFHSNTKPSMFDYPPEQEVKTEEAPEKVKTAVLSTTAQAKRRKAAKDRQNRRESMDMDDAPKTPKGESGDDKMETDENVVETGKTAGEEKDGASSGSKAKKAEKEKVGYELENMSRVLPSQIKYISFSPEGRYQPVKKPTGGAVLLHDTAPDQPKELLELKAKKKTTPSAPTPGQPLGGAAASGADTMMQDSSAFAAGAGAGVGGAAAAAGVLNAVDEDEDDDGEDAPLPEEFEIEDEDEEDEDE